MDRFFRVAALLTIIAVLEVPTPSFAGPLPDTGQTKCYNNTEEITCPQPGEDFYGQDGNYLINPPSYTKLDANGNDLPDSATGWSMVRDNVTGLIWEVKTDDGSIHDKDNTYNWHDAQDVFIIQVNASDFGGYSDWRLPTVKELTSIANMGRSAPVIDTDFFPNTKGEQGYSNYWSNSPYASNSDETWYVDFSYLQVYWGHKSIKYYVRCVRGEQTINSFVDNADGTVTETTTGLMWQQAPASGQYNWKEALSFGDNLILAGYDDWRLPNQRELQSIADYEAYNPAIDTNYFPGTLSSYWASSRTPVSFPYRVSFDSGQVFTDWAAEHVNVRGVRGGQNQISGHLFITSPDQASMYKIGNPMSISWEPQGIAGNVQLSISLEGGKEGTFEIIEETTQNDGTYNWTITEPVSVNCVLKIEPLSDISKGTIQGLFTIYGPPTVRTGLASSVGSESVTLNGTVNPGFVSATAVFEWGTDATYGNEISATQNPLTGHTDQNVSAKLTGLSPGTTYHYRVKATNTAGSSYGGDQSFVTSNSGAIIHIPSDYTTIQAGINAASNGDTVLVADGTYTGEGNKNLDFKGKAITVQSENGAEKCIIDCENEGRGFYFHSGEGAESVVSGFTVMNGKISDNSDNQAVGGGILCDKISSPTITNCIISGNQAVSSNNGGQAIGGGIVCLEMSSPIITKCTISGNRTIFSPSDYPCFGKTMGGGIYCFDYCSPTINNSVITNNSSENGEGGAIYLNSGSSPIINDCIITTNTATSFGGGIACRNSSSPSLTNCTISKNIATDSAGIFCHDSSLILNNCRIDDNEASGHGGGMSCFESSLALTNCSVSNNKANHGGGLYLSMTSSTITNCIIEGNSATGSMGGGIYSVGNRSSLVLTSSGVIRNTTNESGGGAAVGGHASIIDCSFIMNQAKMDGGALYLSASFTNMALTDSIISENTCGNSGGGLSCDNDSSTTITNSIISENTSGNSGGALNCDNDSSVTIVNCTIPSNKADSFGGAIYCARSSITGTNCILWNNSPEEIISHSSTLSLTYSDVQGGYSGSANINEDPVFVSGDNYHLSSSSPCIDEGNNDAPGLPETDKDGNPRIVNSVVDMGAYEYNPEIPMAVAGPDQTVYAGTVVTLDGSHSSDPEGAALNYLWIQIGGSIVSLSDSTAVQPTFIAPEKSSALLFQLTVTNVGGLSNSDWVAVTLEQTTPSVTTTNVSNITSSTASSGGNVTSEGDSPVTAKGVCWSTSANPTTSDNHTSDGSGTGAFTSSISGLNAGTTYYVRAYATNSSGTAYGDDKSFTTSASAPMVSTGSATSVTSSSATLNGTISPNGASTTYHFEYGTTTAYGLSTISTSAGSGTTEVTVTANITELSSNTTYHFRLAATNSVGTTNGSDRTFFTSTIPPVAPSVTTGSATYITSTSATLRGQINPNGSGTEAYFEYGPTTDYGHVTTAEDIGSGSSSVSVSATITDLIPDTAYHYRLTATNSGGTSFGDDKILYQELIYVSLDGTCGGNTPCFLSIQNAIDSATSCSLIRICEGAFDEDVIADQVYGLILSGGWDSTFTVQGSETVIHSLTITETGGSVETDNIVLQ